MDNSTKIFVAGLLCAAIIAAAGYGNTYRLERQLHALESECVEQHKKSEWAAIGELVCDANSLADLDSASPPLKGTQALIVRAQREASSSREWPYLIALLTVFLSALPWLWYFFLRRIAEMSHALRGK